jgi:hypothetical protein
MHGVPPLQLESLAFLLASRVPEEFSIFWQEFSRPVWETSGRLIDGIDVPPDYLRD